MTRYIAKHRSRDGKNRKAVITIPTGTHPKYIPTDSPLKDWPTGTRIFYESNGQEVAIITLDRITKTKRITWHRI